MLFATYYGGVTGITVKNTSECPEIKYLLASFSELVLSKLPA
jgi:hypothetical protein